jgi:hypothetical protein
MLPADMKAPVAANGHADEIDIIFGFASTVGPSPVVAGPLTIAKRPVPYFGSHHRVPAPCRTAGDAKSRGCLA